MSTWNDDRLDELSGRTDAGFEEVKGEIKDLRAETKDGFARVDKRFESIDERFHRLWATLVIATVGIIGSIVTTGILA